MIDRELLRELLGSYKKGEQREIDLCAKIPSIDPIRLTNILLRYEDDELLLHETITEIERFSI